MGFFDRSYYSSYKDASFQTTSGDSLVSSTRKMTVAHNGMLTFSPNNGSGIV